jgi:uridine kinase
VHGDDYFEPHDDPITWGDFNQERLDAELLSRLRRAERIIAFRPYDFSNGGVGPERTVVVQRGVIFERWFALSLDVRWDLTVWVDTPPDVCLQRGMARDGSVELGERARLAWETVWQQREAAYIQKTRPLDNVDIVIDGTSAYELQLG